MKKIIILRAKKLLTEKMTITKEEWIEDSFHPKEKMPSRHQNQ